MAADNDVNGRLFIEYGIEKQILKPCSNSYLNPITHSMKKKRNEQSFILKDLENQKL